MNKKQLLDAISDGRVEAAEGILEQFVTELEQAVAARDSYDKASTDDLKRMAENGDSVAAAYYVRQRIEEDVMTADDLVFLDNAILDLCPEAANLGAYIYGLKGCLYEDREKELFCYAVLEQTCDPTAHKQMEKAARRGEDLTAIDDTILRESLAAAIASNLQRGFTCCRAVVEGAEKNTVPDWKAAYELRLALSGENMRPAAEEDVYTFYCRGKMKEPEFMRMTEARLKDFFTACAAKCGFTSVSAMLAGKESLLWGGGVVSGKRKDAPLRFAEDVELEIDVTKKGRLESETCPVCGGKAERKEGNFVCSACGSVTPISDNGYKVEIADGAEQLEALKCTQCGASVELDGGGKTAFCPACGTTYAINGGALTGEVFGLDFASLRAGKPKDAEIPEIRFMRAHALNGAVETVLPKSFIEMPDDMVKIKYPVNPPEYIYTTPDSKVNLCFRAAGKLAEKDVFAFGESTLTALKKLQPAAKFGEAEKLTDGHNVFFFDFLSPAADQPIYNAMFFFSLNGTQAMGSWNCLGKDRWFWAPVFKLAVKTMRYGDAVKI